MACGKTMTGQGSVLFCTRLRGNPYPDATSIIRLKNANAYKKKFL